MNLNNKIHKRFGKISLELYVKEFLKNITLQERINYISPLYYESCKFIKIIKKKRS